MSVLDRCDWCGVMAETVVGTPEPGRLDVSETERERSWKWKIGFGHQAPSVSLGQFGTPESFYSLIL